MSSVLTIHQYEGHTEEDEEGGARGTRGRYKAYKILVGNPDTESSLGKPKSRYKDNFKVYLIRCGVRLCRMF